MATSLADRSWAKIFGLSCAALGILPQPRIQFGLPLGCRGVTPPILPEFFPQPRSNKTRRAPYQPWSRLPSGGLPPFRPCLANSGFGLRAVAPRRQFLRVLPRRQPLRLAAPFLPRAPKR